MHFFLFTLLFKKNLHFLNCFCWSFNWFSLIVNEDIDLVIFNIFELKPLEEDSVLLLLLLEEVVTAAVMFKIEAVESAMLPDIELTLVELLLYCRPPINVFKNDDDLLSELFEVLVFIIIIFESLYFEEKHKNIKIWFETKINNK